MTPKSSIGILPAGHVRKRILPLSRLSSSATQRNRSWKRYESHEVTRTPERLEPSECDVRYVSLLTVFDLFGELS